MGIGKDDHLDREEGRGREGGKVGQMDRPRQRDGWMDGSMEGGREEVMMPASLIALWHQG